MQQNKLLERRNLMIKNYDATSYIDSERTAMVRIKINHYYTIMSEAFDWTPAEK